MNYRYLDKIKSPEDVKKLNKDEIDVLCAEVRNCLIETVSENGGHLASNLGTVELTVALHRVFSSPEDSIIFDVGHQSYTHKLLTGRFDKFSTLRKKDGISGYMKPSESPHDPFITGHSSNSISAAYGIYKAKSVKGESGTAVAVIGDGALTGGMAYEALNNAGAGHSNFVVVLNDNKMSISRNVGGLARYLNVIRSSKKYYTVKARINSLVLHIPFIGKRLYSRLFSSKTMLKNALYHSNIFEGLGFNYLGPVDGHNVEKLERLLTVAKNHNRPTLVHVVTVKGKGYPYAENKPKDYHGVSAFDADEGLCGEKGICYSSVAAQTLEALAGEDEKICAVTAAMSDGTGLETFAAKYKNRFFDVGIAEEHALTFTAGLASKGLKPYFCVYSSFLQRAYDQIIHDAAIGDFPIRLCIDRAGLVGEDGETHQGLFDPAFLSSVPGMTVFSPASFDELKNTLISTKNYKGILAIRYPRGKEIGTVEFNFTGKTADTFFDKQDNLVITYGRLSYNVFEAAREAGNCTFLKLNKIYPIEKEISDYAMNFSNIVFFEEAEKSGGISEHLSSFLCEAEYKGSYLTVAVQNRFVPASSVEEAFKENGFDKDSIKKVLRGRFSD